MAFSVGDIVKKTSGSQTYKVDKIVPNSKYECKIHPNISPNVVYTFKEIDLVLVS